MVQVKFAMTSGIRIEDLDETKAVVSLKNRRRVQNHIGGVHACGMALLAESATGGKSKIVLPSVLSDLFGMFVSVIFRFSSAPEMSDSRHHPLKCTPDSSFGQELFSV